MNPSNHLSSEKAPQVSIQSRRSNIVFLFFPAIFFWMCIGALLAKADGALVVNTLRLAPAAGMVRAELKYGNLPKDCAGVLVLCPGYNSDGEFMLRQKDWQEFAKKQRLLPVSIYFVSEVEDLSSATRKGYYYAENGSGKLLLDGLKKISGGRELPIVIFGFSGGAHFTHRFVYHYPKKIRVWAAYSFGWHDLPKPLREGELTPPGLFVCGLYDDRLRSVCDAFRGALRAKWRVSWLGVPESDHVMEPDALARTREYFAAVLSSPPDKDTGIWIEKEFGNGLEGFILRMWFPNEKIQKILEK